MRIVVWDVKFDDNVRAFIVSPKFAGYRHITICTVTNLLSRQSVLSYSIHNPEDEYDVLRGRDEAMGRALRAARIPKSLRRRFRDVILVT